MMRSTRRPTEGSCGGMNGAMACAWMELRHVDSDETEGWRGGAARSTYVDCEGGGRWPSGGYSRSFKYPLRTGVGIPMMTRFRLPGGQATGRMRRSDYQEIRSFLVLFLICTFLSVNIFYSHIRKSTRCTFHLVGQYIVSSIHLKVVAN